MHLPVFEDPFRHHPALRGKIVPAEESAYRTRDFSDLDARLKEAGLPSAMRRSDENREESRRATLAGREGQDMWVFAYGSLMWEPAFHFSEVRRAHLEGYHRRFCLRSEFGRGTPDSPGLMAGLDKGGSCHGLAFRIPAEIAEEESHVVWRREMLFFSYVPEFLPVGTEQGRVEALSFVVNPDNPLLLPPMSLDETARIIARAEGHLGPNIDYVEKLASAFELLGIEDAELFELRDKARAYKSAPSGQP